MSKRRPSVLAQRLAAIACAALVPLVLGNNAYYLSIAISAVMFAMPALGAWLLMTTGLWSFGQGALASVGSYTAALLILRHGLSFWLALPAGCVAAGVVAALLAYPFLRARGVAFSILTLVTLLAVDEIITLTPGFTGGGAGLINVPPLPVIRLLGQRIDLGTTRNAYYTGAALLLLCLWVASRIRNDAVFRTLRATRERELLTRSLGIDATWYRAQAFVVGAMFTGLAGAYSASYLQVAHPRVWDLMPSIFIVAYAVVGGEETVLGPVIGSVAVIAGTALLPQGSSYQPIIVGIGLVLVVLFAPAGLSGLLLRLRAIRAVRLTLDRCRRGARPRQGKEAVHANHGVNVEMPAFDDAGVPIRPE